MSQLKAQLAVVLKYGFWIGTAVVLLVSVAMWYLSTDKLIAEYNSNESKIKSDVSTVSTIRGQLPSHPNELSHARMEALIADRQDEVLKSWKLLYERQRPILTWPKELNEDFRSEFEGKIPIEAFIEFSSDGPDPTEQTLRIQYSRYIKNVLPEIAEIAGAEWVADFESAAGMGGMGMGGMDMGGGMGMGMGMGGMGGGPMQATVSAGGVKEGPLVEWSAASQSAVLQDLFPWRGRPDPPTTLEIYYSQENIWILKQLLGIVSDVNGGAQQRYQAKIREIKRLSIGRSVSFKAGMVDRPGMGAMGMGGMGMDMGMGMGMGMDMGMGMGMGMGGPGMSPIPGMMTKRPDPAENRYVDAAKEPISASALRSALTSKQPSDVALAVAKRVPVMLSVKIDQRSIPKLLATCGSVPLMVEIQQVRVLPADASSNPMEGMAGGDMGMGMGDSMDMGMGMGGMGMGTGGMGGAPTQVAPVSEFPFDMTCEIYGLIYIYNPPEREKLGLEEIDADTELGDGPEIVKSEEPETPPAAPPAQGGDVLPTPPAATEENPTAPAAPSDTPEPDAAPPADSPPLASTAN